MRMSVQEVRGDGVLGCRDVNGLNMRSSVCVCVVCVCQCVYP